MSPSLISLETFEKGIAVLKLARPEKRNALNIELLNQLGDTIDNLQRDTTNRVLVLGAEGPVFCAGLDLAEATDESRSEESANGIRRLLTMLRATPLVVIGAAVGSAYAGGAGILAACDLVVASDDFQLGFPEVRRGLVAAMVSVAVKQKVRQSDLSELLLVAESIPADRATRMGLINWTVPRDQVMTKAIEIARSVLAGGPDAIRETKKLITGQTNTMELGALKELHERIRLSDEAKEGLNAFLERREPHWRSDT